MPEGFAARPCRRAASLLSPAILLPLFLLSGCARGCTSSRPPIHMNPNMDQQPRYEAQASSDFFYDGAAMRPPVDGTVARGELRDGSPFWTGKDAAGGFVTANPVALDDAIAARGANRYAIYCGACHDQTGDGKGILFERGKVPTPSFHDPRLRALPDGQIFDTITNGVGLMPSYKYPLPVADRWAIVAHVRTLQARRAAREGIAMPPPAVPTPPAAAPAPPAEGTP